MTSRRGGGVRMSSFTKGLKKVEVALKWDPSPAGSPPHDLDIVAATYTSADPGSEPAYVVHFDSRSPDGTINLDRDSTTGQGFGFDEVMTLELERLSTSYARVVVGVAIQQGEQATTFGAVANTAVRVREGYTDLALNDFSVVADSTAAVVAEFIRDDSGAWAFRELLQGFDTDPTSFAATMGSAH
ncbi:TerD family protein [Streptomyces sp. NPDC046821]|uniref:TerD family protein n=1 Tax=Streptomyces sp. NPDC046821 TaxID=3154702 RepID=UPI0033C71FFD